MKTITLIILIVLMISPKIYSQNTCRVTYIANEGFLIEAGGKKVLTDAMFNTIGANWCDSPSEETVRAMRRAQPPFDRVDLITVSHKHIDHFDADIVIDHLIHNPEGVLLCPEQTALILKEHPDYQRVSERIIVNTPEPLHDSRLEVSGIAVRILRLEHSHYMETDSASGVKVNRHRDIENVGYLLKTGGFTFFHCGDTNPLNEEEYRTFSLQDEAIDVAFLERLFFAKGRKGIEMIDTFIKPEKIVVMHINPANRNLFADMFRENPDVRVFEKPLEPFTFKLGNGE